MAGRNVLVTGGAGFIGSHAVVELLNAGDRVTIVDNLSNSRAVVIERIERIAGVRPRLVVGDVRDGRLLVELMRTDKIDAILHFAGLKAVGESVAEPLKYYGNNVVGSFTLLEAATEVGVTRLVFSSSATVYGDPHAVPIREDWPLHPTNPYGQTKRIVEDMLRDVELARPDWRIAILRYFNPIGAHVSGLIGEDPSGVPNNLLPYVCQVAAGRRERLLVYGDDWATPDGTGVRDYIHVVDLARGHVAALEALERPSVRGLTVNLGTGRGYSVLEVVAAVEAASGRRVPRVMVARRPGDIAVSVADPQRALDLLGWRATLDLTDMCRDAWRWQSQNPNGYADRGTE